MVVGSPKWSLEDADPRASYKRKHVEQTKQILHETKTKKQTTDQTKHVAWRADGPQTITKTHTHTWNHNEQLTRRWNENVRSASINLE